MSISLPNSPVTIQHKRFSHGGTENTEKNKRFYRLNIDPSIPFPLISVISVPPCESVFLVCTPARKSPLSRHTGCIALPRMCRRAR